MKPYTINGVRTTLYSIIQNVFTPTFVSKYERNIGKYSARTECILAEEAERADLAVVQLSMFLDSPAMLESLSRKMTAKTIFTIYIRYYWLSRYLERQDQSDTISLPENKADFFKYLLIDYWKNSLQEHHI
ncbi:MAG: hypothetical protein K2P41_12675 [Lachnospiraceae bacterium]|nr:hypothetical protein [Lachnospiraceae bacterium]